MRLVTFRPYSWVVGGRPRLRLRLPLPPKTPNLSKPGFGASKTRSAASPPIASGFERPEGLRVKCECFVVLEETNMTYLTRTLNISDGSSTGESDEREGIM